MELTVSMRFISNKLGREGGRAGEGETRSSPPMAYHATQLVTTAHSSLPPPPPPSPPLQRSQQEASSSSPVRELWMEVMERNKYRTLTHIHTHSHIYTHTRMHARTHTRTHARTHTRTHIRTRTHTCTHTGPVAREMYRARVPRPSLTVRMTSLREQTYMCSIRKIYIFHGEAHFC